MSKVETTSQNLLGRRLRSRAIIESGVPAKAITSVVAVETVNEATAEIDRMVEQRRVSRPTHIALGPDVYLG